MNPKKVKNRYEHITTNLKQNFKGKTPLKLSDNENQRTNYSKNASNNINSNISNKNIKTNQNLNRANSSINNSKIIMTNSNNNSLCNNNTSKNNQNNNHNTSEKVISPIYKKARKHNSNNNNFKHLNKELKNIKYIFDTYDKDEKEAKKGSLLYIKTEENKKNNSCKKQSEQKKKLKEANKNSFKSLYQMNINNNSKHNLNIINRKKKGDKKTFTRTFSGCNNKRKNSNNNNKNSNNNLNHGSSLNLKEPLLCDEKNKNKKSYAILEREENKKNEEIIFSKSAKKGQFVNSLGKNENSIKNQKVVKFSIQNNKYRGKSPINENSNYQENKLKENTFLNNNIKLYNMISDVNSNFFLKNKKQNIKNNEIKKAKIKYKQQYNAIKGKNHYSSNKLKNNEKQNYFSNKITSDGVVNDKYYQKKIEKISNYNQTEIKIPKLKNTEENKININKINEKLIERKKSDNSVNSFRKGGIKIYEQSNRESNFINKEKKSESHIKEKDSNKKEIKYKLKSENKNYIKKINNLGNYSKNIKNSPKLPLNEELDYYNRLSCSQHKSNCNSESKKNNKSKINNQNSKNYLRGNSTLSNRIKSLSFQNNKLTNYSIVKYPINEIKENEIIENKNSKINTEENEKKNDIKINVKNCTLIINISSNWGNKKYLGINEIELYDKKNKKIKISECIVIGGNNQNIKNIFNNKMNTMNENNMWVTVIKNQKSSYNLKIKLVIYISAKNNNGLINEKNDNELFNEINYILIWNYNGIELNKGIKKIEVLDKYGNVHFVGIIPKGEHSITNYHPYKIKIHQNKTSKCTYGLIKSQNLLLSSYKHDTEHSIECNSNSIRHSLAPQNKNNDVENDNKKNLYYSVIRLSSKKEEDYSEIKQYFPSNLNRISSSRSFHKDKKEKMEKNYRKISTNKQRRIIDEKKNSNKNNKENNKSKNSDNNMKCKSNKLSHASLLEAPNIKSIIPKEKENNDRNIIKQNNQNNTYLKMNTNNLLKSEYLSENKISILSLSENQNMLLFTRNSSQNTLPYILFQKIRINILSNYGNKSFVGLTGFNLKDMYNQEIDIKTAISIVALPKDLRTIYENKENIFNDINNTIDENNMWLTLINPLPFLEINFEKPMTLSKIEIWNYNEALSLDKGAKEIEIMFDSDENRKYCIMLWKGLGIDYYNYYQTILVEKLPETTKKTIQLKYNHLKFRYNTNYLPIGFVVKIIFIKNFGDKNIISLKNMELYDENDKKLDKYIIINDNINVNKNNKNDFFYYHDLYDFRKNEDSICNNLLFICFEDIIQIKYIKLENTNNDNLIKSSTRYIQIYLDDILIFEGVLNQKGESILLFDKKDINNFKNIVNINKKFSRYTFKETTSNKCCILTNLNV